MGYHDKFFGWPGMYTGFASLPEADHTRLGLVVLDHRWSNEKGWVELGTAHRWLEDDYDFDRRSEESGVPGSFEHATRSFSLGLAPGKEWAIGSDATLAAQAGLRLDVSNRDEDALMPLFAGNPDLGREFANTLTLSVSHERSAWLARAAAFYRRDDDLVDWTYLQGAPYVRQANPVDINVTGLEGLVSWQSRVLDIVGLEITVMMSFEQVRLP